MKQKALKIFFLSFVCCLMQNSIQAQSKIFENVLEISLENSVTIENNGTIVGYALFYKMDKVNRKLNLYRLEILDENLKSIGSNEFEGSKELILNGAEYESNHILLSFTDPKKLDGYVKFVKLYDLKGKQTGHVYFEPEKKGSRRMEYVANTMEQFYNGMSNVEGKGFVAVYQNPVKTGGAAVQMIDVNGKLKWERTYTEEKGKRMDMYLTSVTPEALLFYCYHRNGMMSKDAEVFLMGINPDNGKQLFKKPMTNAGYVLEPMYFKESGAGELIMINTLSEEDDKYLSARPKGFGVATINTQTGDISGFKKFLYADELSNVLEMKTESKSEEGYLQIHDVCLMKDGSKVVVGEFFRRTVSALGMGMKILAGGGAGTQISIGDLFLLRIDKNDKPVSIEKFEKDVDRIALPVDGLPLGLMQRYLKFNGSFGYQYTDEQSDPSKKTVVVDGAFGDEKYTTNALTFDEKKGHKLKTFDVKKSKHEKVWINKAKPGHVMIFKYNSKEKKVSMNLERLN